MGNSLKINKSLYSALLGQAIVKLNHSSEIVRDIDRTFVHLFKSPEFLRVLGEASLLLHMFTVK